jgi:acyl-homoserine lactone acylase PvdQ
VALCIATVRAGEVTILRDAWGVPHIYGESQEDAAFGHGYAQAEDRLDDMLAAWAEADGRAARMLGPEWVERDYLARVARHSEIAHERYDDLSGEARRLIEAFVAGVRAYIDEHPQDLPAGALPPEPADVVSLYRAFIWAWPWGQARGDLRGRGSRVGDGRGSNEWVVGPGRTADGSVIALIDPHLSWRPANLFYEAHVHGGDLHFFGFSVIGTPLMAVGHTNILSLACTTGGPDCADVYEERIDPEDPLRYEHDGEWRPIRVEEVEIEVATEAGLRTETRRIERTHHGPIVDRHGDRAWAVRTAYDEEIGILDQWLSMVKARNLGEFVNAMGANQSLPQNVMYGDIYGQTYYVRAGRVPVRPAGYDWDAPVPGWTSKTDWEGIHPFQELVQIINPPAGFMQNCNISPGTMMPNSPLTSDRYPTPIYNTRTDYANSRGRRAVDLLGRAKRLTLEQALRVAVDTYVDRSDRWLAVLSAAWEDEAERNPELRSEVEGLLGWNGRMDVESREAALYRAWMHACREKESGVPRDRIEAGAEINEAGRAALLAALTSAVGRLQATYGRTDVAWGEVQRAGRGGHSWPVGGASGDGIKTLRTVRGGPPDDRGAYSVTPFGQSNHPDSPHFVDQGLRLFSKGQLKPTWYDREELEQHIESRKTLHVPDARRPVETPATD